MGPELRYSSCLPEEGGYWFSQDTTPEGKIFFFAISQPYKQSVSKTLTYTKISIRFGAVGSSCSFSFCPPDECKTQAFVLVTALFAWFVKRAQITTSVESFNAHFNSAEQKSPETNLPAAKCSTVSSAGL